MHGTVMKITEHGIVVLCEDGKFRNVPHPSVMPKLGDRIQINPVQQADRNKKTSRVLNHVWVYAASILLLLGIGLMIKFMQSQAQPVALVAIDINPSIELYVDKEGSVDKASLINDDAKSFMSERELQGRELYEAVQLILSKSEERGYLDSKTLKKWVWVSVVDLGNAPFSIDAEKIAAAGKDYEVELLSADRNQIEKAQEAGLSLNKYVVYEQAKVKGVELNIEQLRTQSIITTLASAGIDPERLFEKKQEPTSSNQPQKDEGKRAEVESVPQEAKLEPSSPAGKQPPSEPKRKEEAEPVKTNPVKSAPVMVQQKANDDPDEQNTSKQTQTEEPSGNSQEQPSDPEPDDPPESKEMPIESEDKPTDRNPESNIEDFELTVELAGDETIKLSYKVKDGKVEAAVAKKSKQGEERQQGEQAALFVADVLDRLALSGKIDKASLVDRILIALDMKQKRWSLIEFHVEFSNGEELQFDRENPVKQVEAAAEKKEVKAEENKEVTDEGTKEEKVEEETEEDEGQKESSVQDDDDREDDREDDD